jgi:hypothetical protein
VTSRARRARVPVDDRASTGATVGEAGVPVKPKTR